MKLKRSEILTILITVAFLILVAAHQIVTSRPTAAVTVFTQKQMPQTTEVSGSLPAADAAALINLNTATVDELQALSGIGPTLAQRIVDYREANGPFEQAEEITSVKGIAEKVYSDNLQRMTVE